MNRKLKKLVLNKEVIAKISDGQMNYLRGGGDTYPPGDIYLPIDNTKVPTIPPWVGCDYPPSPQTFTCVPDTGVGSGCDAETCGVAYTCNGR